MAKIAIGSTDQVGKLVNIQQHPQEPHDGQCREVFVQLAARLVHLGTAIADELRCGMSAAKFAHQVGGMQVATRFANREKDRERALMTGRRHGCTTPLAGCGKMAAEQYGRTRRLGVGQFEVQ